MRPLFLDFPADPACWEVQDQFLFGDDILVAPVVTEGARERRVYLPAGAAWRDAWTGAPAAAASGSPRRPRSSSSRCTCAAAPSRGAGLDPHPGVSRLEPGCPQRPHRFAFRAAAQAVRPAGPERARRVPRPAGALPPGRPAGVPDPGGPYVLFAFVVPVIYNLILSFEVTTPATIASLFAPWAGLSNYKSTLDQSITQSALVRTLTFTVRSLIFQFLIGFGLALLFNLKFPLNRLARSLVIVPWLLPFLVTGFIFRFLFQLEAGAVNQVLLDLHLINQPIGYLLSPGWAYSPCSSPTSGSACRSSPCCCTAPCRTCRPSSRRRR